MCTITDGGLRATGWDVGGVLCLVLIESFQAVSFSYCDFLRTMNVKVCVRVFGGGVALKDKLYTYSSIVIK